MTRAAAHPLSPAGATARAGNGLFVAAALGLACGAALLAGWAPLGFSIVTVFLFAGPHNWMESRYFLSRMPARWGPLRTYYLTGIAGVLTLTAVFAALPHWGAAAAWDAIAWDTAMSLWNTLLIAWLWTLVQLRSRQNPRRDWAWTTPVALLLIAAAWLAPAAWDLALVYLHPIVALVFLERELRRQRAPWLPAYRACLAVLPAFLGVLWWRLADAPDLPGNDVLSARIAGHAGATILSGVSSHLLVATHTFLEMLHYGVWLVAIPFVAVAGAPWRVRETPLGRRSIGWHRAVAALLIVGALAVVGFWVGFLADYPLTRDVYFTVAMVHVLAEAPFLLRLL